MKVEISDLDGGRKQVRIEADWRDVEPDYEDLLSEYAKLPVPGFRSGKAPRSMVEKHYERPLLDDTAARSVRRISRRSLESEGITATGPIAITEISIERGEPFNFTAEFTELPGFELPDYGSISLEAESDDGMRDEISMYLLEETELVVADEMVRQELSFDGIEDAEPGSDEWNAALVRVKLLLILGAIARRDGIEVDERDVEGRIARIAKANDTEPSSLKKHLMRTGGLSRVADFLLAERTLDYLLGFSDNHS